MTYLLRKARGFNRWFDALHEPTRFVVAMAIVNGLCTVPFAIGAQTGNAPLALGGLLAGVGLLFLRTTGH